jgi:hypothetical protein
VDLLNRRARDALLLAGLQLDPLNKINIEAAPMREYSSTISALQKALFFQFRQVFSNCDLANCKPLCQIFDLHVALVLEQTKDLMPSLFGGRKQGRIGYWFQSAFGLIPN